MAIKIVIIGTGGNSIDTVEIIEEISESGRLKYKILGFLDDNIDLHGSIINGYKVLGDLSIAKDFSDDTNFVFVIGSDKNYKNRSSIIKNLGISINRFINIIHPTVVVSKSVEIGQGNILFPNVVIGSNARIGNFCLILSNSVINHNCVLGDYSLIASNVSLSGGVKIKESCYLGSSSSVKNDVTIEKNTLVGMGSVVTRNTISESIVVGNPAKILLNGIDKHKN